MPYMQRVLRSGPALLGQRRRNVILQQSVGAPTAVNAGVVAKAIELADGEYGDLTQMGMIDPAEATRNALPNTASVAALVPDRPYHARAPAHCFTLPQAP